MKPTQKTIAISNTSNDTVSVTVFDFKQQILSLLCDKQLMHPSDLYLTNLPGKTSNINIISDINDSDCYTSACNHNNQVICGIILAIDKTHKDTKGKLCLQGILSIINTGTRRNNCCAWL